MGWSVLQDPHTALSTPVLLMAVSLSLNTLCSLIYRLAVWHDGLIQCLKLKYRHWDMKDNWVGREMARSTSSPAHGTAALGLSLFSFSDPLPLKTWVWREDGRSEEADGSQTPVFFYLFLSFLFNFKSKWLGWFFVPCKLVIQSCLSLRGIKTKPHQRQQLCSRRNAWAGNSCFLVLSVLFAAQQRWSPHKWPMLHLQTWPLQGLHCLTERSELGWAKAQKKKKYSSVCPRGGCLHKPVLLLPLQLAQPCSELPLQ